MIPRVRRRGAPLAALGLVLGGWIAARALMLGVGPPPSELVETIEPVTEADAAPAVAVAAITKPAAMLPTWLPIIAGQDRLRLVEKQDAPANLVRSWPISRMAISLPATGTAAMTGLVQVEAGPPPFQPSTAPDMPRDKRWSADGWLLLRPDDGAGSGLLSSYGASQAGAVLRYRLAPTYAHQPAAYLRVAAALDGSRQKEVAAGLSTRPLSALPIVVAAELRVTSDRIATRTRPAVLAYTELPPFDLALGLRGEAYLQGGYVGGPGRTAFVDGQVRADRKVVDLGRGEVRVGAGAWGGAQAGASRLDAGPAAQLAFPLSQTVFARLALDWRQRLAGDAMPGSGPALTLSAGF